MGTPEFAIPSLARILDSSHQICAVVTGKDKRVGRGQRLKPTPVKKFAVENNLDVITPSSLKDIKFIEKLSSLHADLFVVVAFRILPESVFTIPPEGTINLHGSLLPKYRGAAPINWAIINGENETGLTTFFIQKRVDTGDVIAKIRIPIGENDTAGELHDKMSEAGADLLLESIDQIERGDVHPKRQEGDVTMAPKITKEICHINWNMDVKAIHDLVRGLSPYPRAYTILEEKEYKILTSSIETNFRVSDEYTPGEIIQANSKGKMLVATGSGILSIEEIQPPSKRRMSIAEFLRGRGIKTGTILK